MSFHTYKVEHYNKDSTGSYDSTFTELSNIINISVNLAAGESADSFSLSIDDTTDSIMESISIDDRLKIYGSMDGTNFTLLIDGIVNDKQSSGGTSGNIITFTGLNRLEKLFNSIVSTTGEEVRRTASFWVKNIIDQVNEFNSNGGTNRNITYDNTSIIATSDVIVFTRSQEKAFKLIEELSQPKYADGTNYVYSIDENNKFYFKPRSNSVESANLVWGTNVLSHRTQKGMFDIVNYIIMNAGRSLFGASILQFDYNAESINKFGWKSKLYTEGIGSTLGTAEVRNMRNKNVYQEDSVFPSSYPYITGWGVSVATDSEYNSAYVDEVLSRAKIKIVELLERQGSASYKVNVEVVNSFDYSLYNNYDLVLPVNGNVEPYFWSSGVTLRVNNIAWSFNKGGWNTDLKLEQDSQDSEGGL